MRDRSVGSGAGSLAPWTPAEARRALAELKRAGVNGGKLARARGISGQRIGYWKRRFADEAGGAMSFVPVSVPVPATSNSVSRSGVDIEIVVDGVVVRVREEIEVERLAQIVGALVRGVR